MQLDSVGDGKTVPAKRNIFVVGDGFVSAGAERWRKRQSNLSLERIASDVTHLTTDRVEALTFALTNLDGQQLQKMPVSIRGAGARALGPIE
jgi:hypothetical protein